MGVPHHFLHLATNYLGKVHKPLQFMPCTVKSMILIGNIIIKMYICQLWDHNG